MKSCNLFPLFLLISWQAASAQESLPDWYVESLKQNAVPNALGYYLSVHSECPLTKDAIAQSIEQEFVRARIKMLNEFALEKVYLDVGVVCSEITTGETKLGYSWHASIHFGSMTAHDGIPILYDRSYDRYGVVSVESMDAMMTHFNKGIAGALTDYLKANFDL